MEGTRDRPDNEHLIYNINNISYIVNSVAKEEYNLQNTVNGKLIFIRCFIMKLGTHFWITVHHDYSSIAHQCYVCTNTPVRIIIA
jgi:hypothetical protein